jgi:hypothetical protein
VRLWAGKGHMVDGRANSRSGSRACTWWMVSHMSCNRDAEAIIRPIRWSVESWRRLGYCTMNAMAEVDLGGAGDA